MEKQPYSLQLYENPKRSNAALGDVTKSLSAWRRSICATGGYFVGSADYIGSDGEKEILFLEGLGRRIVETVGGRTTWEGFLGEMELESHGTIYRRSLVPMVNATRVIYTKVGANLFTNGGVESSAWTSVGTPATHEQTATWATRGAYGMHILTDAADEGTQIETGITIESDMPYQARMSVEVLSGYWTFAAYRTDTGAVLGRTSAYPRFKSTISAVDSYNIQYSSAAGETDLENCISDNGSATIYNATQNDTASATAINTSTNVITTTEDKELAGWAASDVLGALPNTDVLTFSISADNAYSGTIYVNLTCDGAGEIYADAAAIQRSPYRSETPWYTDDDSIAEYGRKELVLLEGTLSDTAAQALAQTELAKRAWPLTLPEEEFDVLRADEARASAKLTLTFYGYWWTLGWRYARSTGLDTVSNHVTALIGDGDSVFVTAGTVDDNATEYQIEDVEPLKIRDVLEDMIRAGDTSGNRWIGGVYAGQKFVYEQAETTVEYHHRGSKLLLRHGGEVEPWLAAPGLARLDDMPVGPGEITSRGEDDPRNVFISEIEFAAPDELRLVREKLRSET